MAGVSLLPQLLLSFLRKIVCRTRSLKRLFIYTTLGSALCTIFYSSTGILQRQYESTANAKAIRFVTSDPLSGGLEQLKDKNLETLQNMCLDRMTWLDTAVHKNDFFQGIPYQFLNYSRWKRSTPLDIPFLVNNIDKCKDGGPIILIYIFSAVKNIEARNQIRTTWGSMHNYRNFTIKTVFLLGKNNDVSQNTILQENKQHSDIIQGDFLDSYTNVSYKSYFGLKWIANFCPNAAWCIKTDDDVFLNVYYFIDRILEYPSQLTPTGLLCHPISNGEVLRGIPKFGATAEEFPEPVYPPYCSGVYYIYPVALALPLYACISEMNFFKIEDVFTTGVVAHMLNITKMFFLPVGVLTEEVPLEEIFVLHGSNLQPDQIYNSTFLTNTLSDTIWDELKQRHEHIL